MMTLMKLPIAIALSLLLVGQAIANPLKTAPLPRCGVVDEVFLGFLAALNQSPAWRGKPSGKDAELKLYTGRNGAWTLFYYAYTPKGERVCVVGRGSDSRATFGSPV